MLATVEFENENQILSSSSSGGLDMENYYKIDNGLKTKPIFGYTNLLEKINIGDIYYEEKTTANIGHLAIVTGIKYDNYYESYYIELIENAKNYNVCYGMLDDHRFQKRIGSIFRVKDITYSEIDTVINYLKTQLGEEYHAISNNCATLVDKAFERAGYDFFDELVTVLPQEIFESEDVEKIQLNNHNCFKAQEYLKYESINDEYHQIICYCGNTKNSDHIAIIGYNGKRHCKYCLLLLDDSPGFDVPFFKKIKNFEIDFILIKNSLIDRKRENVNAEKR